MPAHVPAASILVADFDSVRQAQLWRDAADDRGAGAAREDFASFLRFVHVIGADVALPAPMLLDGAFFLLLGPDGIRQILAIDGGQPLPLAVTCTDESLRAWHDARASNPAFVWSSQAPLEAAGWTPDMIEQRRRAWIEAGEHDAFEVHQVTGPFPFDEEIASLSPLPGLGDECARLRTIRRRSDVAHLLETSDLAADDVDALWDWWSWAYSSSLARQHGAEWMEFRPNARVTTASAATRGGSGIRVEGSLVRRLGAMSSYRYAALLESTVGAREEWQRGRQTWALRTLSMVVADQSVPAETWIRSCVKTGLWAVVLLILAVSSLASLAFPDVAWLLAVPVLGIVVTDVPWQQLQTLLARRPSEMDALVHVRRTA